MDLRQTISEWRRALGPLLWIILFIAVAVAISLLLPNRSAAAVLGIIAGAVIGYVLLARLQHGTQLAIMWGAIGVVADAAYAKLNDQAPVTVANAVVKLADAVVKLGDAIIKGVGIAPADARGKIAAVTPDFVWALILSMILFMWLRFMAGRGGASQSQVRASRP